MKKILLIVVFFGLITLSYFTGSVTTAINKTPFQVHISHFAQMLKFTFVKYRDAESFNSLFDSFSNDNFKTTPTFWENVIIRKIDLSKYLYNYNDKITEGLPGGYITSSSDENQIYMASGKGDLYSVNTKNLTINIVKSNLRKIFDEQNFTGKVIKNLKGRFGLRDIFYDEERRELLASMFYDTNGKGCYGMSLLRASTTNFIFKPFFITKECNTNFNGHASGGRIKKLNDDYIMTIGSLDHNLYGDIKVPQNKINAIGKVIKISQEGKFKVLSMGHRNQQGLLIINNNIIITEHGPMGGDEINLISQEQLNHYGWPYFAYGYDYDYKEKFRLSHTGKYVKPVFYFSPSIGISEIIYYKNKIFKNWHNKLLVTSLKAKSLFLLDWDNNNLRVLSYEKIYIGHRIRDIAEIPNGKIFIITDDQKLIILEPNKVKPSIRNVEKIGVEK